MAQADDIAPLPLGAVLTDLRHRVEFHKGVTGSASVAWMLAAFVLTWGLPIFSGVVAWAAHANYNAFAFSLALAILTSMNAAINPTKSNAHATKYSNIFWSFGTQLELAIAEEKSRTQNLADHEKDAGMRKLLGLLNKRLTGLIEEYNSGTLLAFVKKGP